MHPVRIHPGRNATLTEFTSPLRCWRNWFAEVAPGVYCAGIVGDDRYYVDMLCTDGVCYYCEDAYLFYYVRVRISTSVDRDPCFYNADNEIKCILHQSHKYASAVALPSGQLMVVYGTVPDEIRTVHAIEQWQYSPQDYTLEIIGDGPLAPGKVATITACHPPYYSDIRYQSIPNYPIRVHFDIWADDESAYITLDNTVYQIRF